MVASLEKTEENSEYSLERVTLGLAASAAMANSVVVVKQAMTGDPAGMNLEPQHMMWWMV